jgi:hypothetical protein
MLADPPAADDLNAFGTMVALLFLPNRLLNPALLLVEVSLNAFVPRSTGARCRASGGACCRS